MATLLTIKNADFSANAIGFAAPVQAGLVGWFFLGGGSAPAIAKDYAFLGNGAVAGLPTFGVGFTSFGGFTSGQWLQTNIAESLDFTVIAVGRTSDTLVTGHQPCFVSNYGTDPSNTVNTGNKGQTLYGGPADSGGAPGEIVQANVSTNNAGTLVISSAVPLDETAFNTFKCLSHTVNSTAATNVLTDLASGTSISASLAYPRIRNVTNKLRIGAGFSSAVGGGTCDIAMVGFWNRALSGVEQQAVYAFMKNYLSVKFSISI